MRKVLILAYDFPPYVSVGGLRPFSWYKYMHEFDAFPIVITRQWNNKYGNHLDYIAPGASKETIVEETSEGNIIRTPYFPNLSNRLMLKYGDSKYKSLRKGITAFYEFGQYLFSVGPKSNLYFGAKDYLSKNKVDIIIATGDPFVLFRYASKLSKKFNIPWIADYRDPWTQDKNRRKIGVLKNWNAYIEKKSLANVTAVTIVSELFKSQIKSLIKNKPIYIVANGFDSEAVDKVKGIKQSNERLRIAIGGTIYKWHPIESFLRVCSNFVGAFSKIPQLEINFYGTNAEKEIGGIIESKYPVLSSIVNLHQKIPNNQFLEKLAESNVFLLFNDYDIVGTKIYNNLALKRRIILCYDDDVEAHELKRKFYGASDGKSEIDYPQKRIINETNSGIVVKDAEHLNEVLKDLYSEFKANKFISCSSINTEQYSRKIQVRNLIEIINNIIKAHQNK